MMIDNEELQERVAILMIDNDIELTEQQAIEQATKELEQRKEN